MSFLFLTGCGNKKAKRPAFNPVIPVEIEVVGNTNGSTTATMSVLCKVR